MSLRFSVSAFCVAVVASAAAFAGSSVQPAALGSTAAASAAATSTNTTSTATKLGPSGLPVPRFVALKKDEVRARFGPSFNYPVAYEFRREGLPLKVIAEDRDNIWRRVEDRDGHRMWIHRSMLAPNQNAIVNLNGAVLRSAPRGDSQGRAKLASGVMVRLETCEEGWCRLRTDDFRGWLPEDTLWGTGI